MLTGREGKRYPMHLTSYKTAPTREGGGRLRMPWARPGWAGSVVGERQLHTADEGGADVVEEGHDGRDRGHEDDVDDADDDRERHDAAETDVVLDRERVGRRRLERLEHALDVGEDVHRRQDHPQDGREDDAGDAERDGEQEAHLHDRPRVDARDGEADATRALGLAVRGRGARTGGGRRP